MNTSYQKIKPVVSVAVLISFSIVLFQNCGKKVGLSSESSTVPVEPLDSKAIDLKIHSSPEINSPEIHGDLNPEEIYYFRVQNVSHNGYA